MDRKKIFKTALLYFAVAIAGLAAFGTTAILLGEGYYFFGVINLLVIWMAYPTAKSYWIKARNEDID